MLGSCILSSFEIHACVCVRAHTCTLENHEVHVRSALSLERSLAGGPVEGREQLSYSTLVTINNT